MPTSHAQTPGFLFAGGGTGGHLYPGLAIAEEIAVILGRPAEVMFLTSTRAIDATVMREAGVAFTPIPAAPPSLHPMRLARFIRSWGGGVRATRAAIRAMRERAGSVVMIATGGFVSAPAVQGARAEKVPVVLVNLDATPGKANRWIARRAAQAFTQMPVEGAFAASWTLVPPIVRSGARPPGDAAHCRRLLGLSPDRPVLMITGGSQGAGSINLLMAAFVRERAGLLSGWQVLHQCGHKDEDTLREAYAAASVPAVVRAFEPALGVWWGAASVAVSRSGAGSVAEAWSAGVPSVLLPYPYHRDQHQKANAARLVEAGGAKVVTDRIQASATMGEFAAAIEPLLTRPEARSAMVKALRGLGPADGAARVARAVLDLARR